jgi:hypothetical protein
MSDKEYLLAAANTVSKQATDNPSMLIPVDPEVADFMGAFAEDAISLADIEDEDCND